MPKGHEPSSRPRGASATACTALTPRNWPQQCERDGKAYACGLEAKAALKALLEGKETVCEPIEQDRYGRTVARCTANGMDVSEEMVRQGWALDYYRYSSYEYAQAEQYAKDRQLGLWAGEFMEPWEWRKEDR